MTLRLPEDISERDTRQWLEGGVFLVDVDGASRVCVAARPDEEMGGSIRYLLDDGSYWSGPSSAAVLSWPVLGWVRSPRGGAVHVTRPNLPGQRLYTRVLSPETIEAAVPSVHEGVFWGVAIQFRATEWRSLFFPDYPKTVEMAAEWYTLFGSVALSPTFCIADSKFFIGRTAVANVRVGPRDIEVVSKVEGYHHSLKPVIKAIDKLRREEVWPAR